MLNDEPFKKLQDKTAAEWRLYGVKVENYFFFGGCY